MISILIPAYNEGERIADTIKSLLEIEDCEIIIINDGSTDDTSDIAKRFGVKVIDLMPNRGKGEALQEGIKHANGDIIVFLDADLGSSAREAIKLINPIKNDEADVTIARFPKSTKKGGFGLVKSLSRYGVKALTGKYIHSVLSGQRAFKKVVIKDLMPFSHGFGIEVGMTIDILRKGYRIKEVDVNMAHNETARDLKGFLHRGVQFKEIFITLVKKAINV
ncbi:Glycosyltransferase involved in cell wall bisynthesis [Caldanaerobius fijiensis DSM 17918]|uniref:Glycosyltransferase involved in cell wall bisynthesis n=1 Tax=Caldanaerobius fijiensis DSM 17918 TaxID=1121256 RepID=A0A1M4U9G0_9THEO|nr:glycosyltransferase family 2 protein [Caldanaerobius fijiensis]SHE53355.1 Glycosyltransferase involved in cell wall bisynthesis [Caldanaerobius fijiensis DSM 17918]